MAQNSSGQRVYLLPDGLGSIRQVISGTNVVAQRDFDPYGNPISTPSVSTPPYGFTGEWWEQDAQLLHLRARWYAPGEGIFLSKDSVESEPPYQYVRGNPINWVDPDGNEFKPPFSNICFFGKDPKTGKCMDPFPGLGGLGTVAQMPAVDPGSAIVKTVGILIIAGIGVCFFQQAIQTSPRTITVPRTYPQTRQEPKSEPTLIPPLWPQPTATPEREYLVRVQVQGKKLTVGAAGDGIPLRDIRPIKASAAIEALNILQARLTTRDLERTDQAFDRARIWVLRAAVAGGVWGFRSESFNNQDIDPSDARVDIEVFRGDVNLVP